MVQEKENRITDTDAREAWTLRAGAELWKVVVAEAECPAADTQAALQAVRYALDCARSLRVSAGLSGNALERLQVECDQAGEQQMLALRHWGRGRGMKWEADWGIQWGEALSLEGKTPGPTCDGIPL